MIIYKNTDRLLKSLVWGLCKSFITREIAGRAPFMHAGMGQ